MKKANQVEINKAIIAEIKGNGFREMKNRFKSIEALERDNITNRINEYSSSAAFSGFAKVANNPLPVKEKTLHEFLEKDKNEKKTNKGNAEIITKNNGDS